MLLTGSCSPKAFRVLQDANIKVIQYMMINQVKDAIRMLNEGKLVFADHANIESGWKT